MIPSLRCLRNVFIKSQPNLKLDARRLSSSPSPSPSPFGHESTQRATSTLDPNHVHFLVSPIKRQNIRLSVSRTYSSSEAKDGGGQFVDNERPVDRITSSEKDVRVFATYSVDDFKEITDSEEMKTRVTAVIADYEYLQYTSYRIPTAITVDQMKELTSRGEYPQRERYFNYLFKREMAHLNDKKKNDAKREALLEKRRGRTFYKVGTLFDENDRPIYGKWHNSMFIDIPDKKINEGHALKLIHSATFGQPLVFDFGFEEYMQTKEIINLSDQLSDCFGINYKTPSPYDLWFCNYRHGSETDTRLMKAIGNLKEPKSFISLKEESYLDIFPKEKLVYLTPHTREFIQEYDDDAVYIIGAIIDKSIRKPVTFAKAKREGIKMARLPIDEHVVWSMASKALTLNQILSILLHVKHNKGKGSWKEALLKYIPKRKLKSIEQIAEEEAARIEKMNFKRKKFFQLDANDTNDFPRTRLEVDTLMENGYKTRR